MLLHNQTQHRLDWEALGRKYRWDAYGACEVPGDLVAHLVAQKFPVAEIPVAPETKARRVAEEERATIRSDEYLRLKESLAAAEADAKAARAEIQAAESRRETAEARSVALSDRVRALESELASAKADTKAAEELIAETTRKLELTERKPKKLEGPKSATS
jgi:predicted  nucleic acid-binding Zn-ribbon protein